MQMEKTDQRVSRLLQSDYGLYAQFQFQQEKRNRIKESRGWGKGAV